MQMMMKTTLPHGLRACLAAMLAAVITACSCGKAAVGGARQTVVHDRDTVVLRDSIVERTTTVVQQADSALMAAFGIRLAGMERAWLVRQADSKATVSNATFVVRRDSVVRDSVPVPYPLTVYKDKEPSAWQKTMMQLGYGCFGIIAGAAVLALWKYKRKP